MKRLLLTCLLAACATSAAAQPPVYKAKYKYPVLDQIEARRDSLKALVADAKAAVDAQYAGQEKAKKDAAMSLRPDWTGVERPAGPDAFKIRLAHLPPVAQYNTGSCWAFSATSFMESEVIRLTKRNVKLSEMWLVYWEYVEKVRRWVREYGHSAVEEGSQGDAILDIYAKYGVVPGEIYTGVQFADGRHDHTVLMDELKSWLKWAEDNGVWDEARVVEGARAILDVHMGRPPETFSWQGRTFSPRSFLLEALRLDPGAYVSCVSRMEQPGVAFYQPCLLDVQDNWRRKADYLNLPLDVFRATAEKALRAGYTAAFGGDNSEPGVDGMMDAAIVPRWDIPGELIDQGSREFRIATGQTGDDHGVHAVGLTTLGGRDWFLIKDSNRSSRLGAYEGYYMFDADYVALKMLTVMVHRDMLQNVGPVTP